MHQEETPRTTLRRPNRAPWIAVALAVAVAAGILLWRRQRTAEPTAVQPVPAPSAEPSAAPTPPPSAAAPRGPATLDSVSPAEPYRRALAEGGVERRTAIVADNLAEDVSPREQLEFLKPSKPFSVVKRGGRTVIAPESYQRYDTFAAAVASIDEQALASVYRSMHGPIESAYQALGYPGAPLDRVVARALGRIAAAPVADGDVVVADDGGIYVFADPKLEAQGEVEKHLLRMGPRNTRVLQAKARELLKAMGLAADAGPQRAP
jgi:hypothetical protein